MDGPIDQCPLCGTRPDGPHATHCPYRPKRADDTACRHNLNNYGGTVCSIHGDKISLCAAAATNRLFDTCLEGCQVKDDTGNVYHDAKCSMRRIGTRLNRAVATDDDSLVARVGMMLHDEGFAVSVDTVKQIVKTILDNKAALDFLGRM